MLFGSGNGAGYEPPEVNFDETEDDLDLWLVACKFLKLIWEWEVT